MSLKRLLRELNEFTQKTDTTIPPDWNISLVNEDNMFEWKATFAGPDNTSYKYGIFEVNIKFGTEYPAVLYNFMHYCTLRLHHCVNGLGNAQ